MPKCDINKYATLLKSHFDVGVLNVNLLHIFRTFFPKNTSEDCFRQLNNHIKDIHETVLKILSTYRQIHRN